jgi:hypothetical protein
VKNRRLASFSFLVSLDDTKKRSVCAQECARNGVPNERSRERGNSLWLPALSVEGGGLAARRFHVIGFRANDCVPYT